MDIRTGKLYESRNDALAAGVPTSDIAELEVPVDQVEARLAAGLSVVKFTKGSFKNFKRDESGAIVRVP